MAVNLTVCPACKEEVPPRLTTFDLLELFAAGHIIDVRAGGLVWGRHDNEDDIPMLMVVANGILQLCGVMQGGEYIVNKEATAKYRTRLEEINSYKSSEKYVPIQSLNITDTTRIFNTNGIKGELLVLLDGGQFVINRAATMKYYAELEEINNSVVHELKKELS